MLGDALLVTPVLEPGAQNVSGYLPGGTTWYSLWHRNASIHSRWADLRAVHAGACTMHRRLAAPTTLPPPAPHRSAA